MKAKAKRTNSKCLKQKNKGHYQDFQNSSKYKKLHENQNQKKNRKYYTSFTKAKIILIKPAMERTGTTLHQPSMIDI